VITLCVALLLAAAPSGDEVVISRRKVMTPDGVALALYRYQRAQVTTSGPPVVLVPDVGFTRAAWDFEGRGLARHLAREGQTVYVAELRGQGKAGAAGSLEAGPLEAGPLEAMGLIDVVTVLNVIGAPQIDLVVQGWVGSLVMASLVDDPRVRRIVAFNTPLLAEPPSDLAEAFLLEGGRFSTLASAPSGASTFDLLFSMGSPFPTGTARGFLSTGTRDLSAPTAVQLLAWMRAGDLPLGSSTVVRRLSTLKAPTLLLLGLADGFAPPEQCAVLRERVPAQVTVRTFSRLETAEDFSHLSMLLGSEAPRRVFPLVSRFLREGTP
jgi:pimeloyl-ACP methyl ester carboxylesterase